MDEVIILVGSPASGKTWVTDQLKDHYHIVENDDYIGQPKFNYEDAIIDATKSQSLPVIGNSPFGISGLMEYLSGRGVKAVPIFVIEPAEVLKRRYWEREGKELPRGHITRQFTYQERARDLKAFSGGSEAVLNHLRSRLSTI